MSSESSLLLTLLVLCAGGCLALRAAAATASEGGEGVDDDHHIVDTAAQSRSSPHGVFPFPAGTLGLSGLGMDTFSLVWKQPQELPTLTKLYEPFDLVTAGLEKVTCFLPRDAGSNGAASESEEEKKEREATDTTPAHPYQLLSHMRDSCVFFHEGYWSYQYCFGKIIRQYHEDKQGERVVKETSFILGQEPVYEYGMAMNVPEGKPSNFFYRQKNYPYYGITYTDGDVCDLNGKARQTLVHFVCDEAAPSTGRITLIKETSTCQYMMVIETHALCDNPAFKLKEAEITTIACVTPGSESGKPHEQLAIEEEQEALHAQRLQARENAVGAQRRNAHIIRDEGASQVYQVSLDRSGAAEATQVPHSQQGAQPGSPSQLSSTPASPQASRGPKTSITHKMLQGGHCFRGGGRGWWKYELCPHKHAQQYHIHETGKKETISLGVWDEARHREWYKATQPDKHVRRTQLSMLYVEGDFCEEVGRNREVIVRMLCRSKLAKDRLAMSLEEPEPCKYVLVLKSSAVCDLIEEADEDGVF